MDDQDNPFDQGQFLRKKGVEQESNESDCYYQQRDVPPLIGIRVEIDGEQSDQHIGHGIGTASYSCVPAQHANPACNVAEEALRIGLSKF